MKRVVTLRRPQFLEACACLESFVADSACSPDVVLGIESGGRYVAEQIFASTPHCYVAMRRESTDSRGAAMQALLGRLPRFLCDMLRRVEDWRVSRRRPVTRAFNGALPAALDGARTILVVDDAVDSGATMKAVCDAVRERCPEARVCTAAIVRTTAAPLVSPDFVLFHNCLIRFPWSADMKK